MQTGMSRAEEIIATQRTSGRIRCPECAETRSKSGLRTCSVTVMDNRTLYDCHHCGWNGVIYHEKPRDYIRELEEKKRVKVMPIPTQLNHDTSLIKSFFAGRGVTIDDVTQLPAMTTDKKFFHGMGEVDAIGFVYGPKDAPEAIKWRSIEGKAFTQTNAAREFYGIERLTGEEEEIIIVEGEADVVALASIGIKAISCPNGAPQKVKEGRIDPEEDGKFSYIWEAREILNAAKKVVLAVDQDEAGDALAEEIARRVDRAKCWRTSYPDGCKDVTDVLRDHGKEAVESALTGSEPMPLAGVYTARSYTVELLDNYRDGYGRGETTGYSVVDDLFTIKEGQLSVVTGLPGSGKSEFIDQLMVNLAMKRNWKFAVASFENPPAFHIAKLAEKIVGKPFHEGKTPRMRHEELESAVEYINDHFVFLEQKDGNMATIESIIDRAKQAVMRLGVRGLVIDPFNYIQQTGDKKEHEWISEILSRLSAFARAKGLHIWFVAHPAKMQPREDGSIPVPKGMHISGSAAWFAKADIGITVHRGSEGVEIHCWKVRFKWIGQTGMTVIGYDVPTGRYFEDGRTFQRAAQDRAAIDVSAVRRAGSSRGRHWQDLDDDLEELGL